MAKTQELLPEKYASVRKEKKKFNKNNSFSGVEARKSPKNRRKSIAAVLPTSLKKKKKEKSSNEWVVSNSDFKDTAEKRKQLVITDSTYIEINNSLLKTKIRNKKRSKTSFSVDKQKKQSKDSSELKKQLVPIKKREIKEHLEDKLNGSSTVVEPEQKFGIEANDIAKAVKAVIKLHKENPKLKNQLFNDNINLFLQVCCHKVPRGPSRIIRIPLSNSLLTPDDEVCLIVSELKGVKNIEHEKHIEHYENLLRNKGVENIKKIMTFHEFRTEYETFEQKSRLVDLYDMFLVDGRISGKVVNKCGKIFYNKRKVPTAIKLEMTKLKEHIDKALSKAFFLLHQKGDSYTVQFGHDKMDIQHLVDNVFSVIECLNKEFPGGFDNIKGLHISTIRSTSIPLYSSFSKYSKLLKCFTYLFECIFLESPKEILPPKTKSKKPKGFKTYKGELTTLPNAKVIVKPTGQVLVIRTKNEDKDMDVAVSKESEIENKKNEGVTKKTKKRKHNEVELDECAAKNVEVDSKENGIKKKRKNKTIKVSEAIPEVNTVRNLKKKGRIETNKSEDEKLKQIKKKKSVKGKSKYLVNANKKEKKNKKVKM